MREANTLEALADLITDFRSDLEHSFDHIDIELTRCNLLRRKIFLKNARVTLKNLNEIDQDSY